ncbi:MAG: hypothetical protein IKY78_00025 [Clostridia bacterium]|nr:hypothetical protein [Clostridia bacterium]
MIFKETGIRHPLYTATLSNGVTIQVYGDTAEGDDGKTYRHVGVEVDGVLITAGWECEE